MQTIEINALVRSKIEQLYVERQMIDRKISETLTLLANSAGIEVKEGEFLQLDQEFKTLTIGKPEVETVEETVEETVAE